MANIALEAQHEKKLEIFRLRDKQPRVVALPSLNIPAQAAGQGHHLAVP